ncbi:MAG TPA: S8 family serine peptidase, partial [Chthoniobacterales bacterium]|nr:S8 family serine peptidase [Chthoniobacterales bacterium]
MVFASTILGSAQTLPIPENLGLGLRQLAELSQSDPPGLQTRLLTAPAINSDGAGRVLVNINLDGKAGLAEVESKIVGLGGEITATDDQWRHGVISAWLPLSGTVQAADMTGVRSVALARKPVRRVGAVTAESSVAERAADVNTPGVLTPQGILGRHISIGLVSDSFDTATTAPRASVAVASGDLPGPGNPDGYTQPVVVLQDDPTDTVDEGRAMAEIVHDIAPAAKICFSAAGATQASMAASIRNLRTSPQTLCDIIVDDIGFSDEPFFSDGAIARAIDDVATSGSLAGKKVAFFSAAGNSNNHGYLADANIISTAASAPYRGNIRLTSVPSSLYAGGFQNLNATGTPGIIMNVTTADDPATLIFQWDDPFNTGGVTTDYNVLLFSTTGTYLASASGTDNNFATSQPLEIVDLAANTTYQLVISLASNSQPVARHLVMLSFGAGTVSSDYLTSNVITLFGHAAAVNANAVAAYVYNDRPSTIPDYNPGKSNPPPGPYEPVLEGFSARGGSVPIYFTAQGQRLPSPDLRKKPEFAATDGVDTSFFPQDAGSDYDNNGYPNFFGTSAAAPNAGAFAALLLEAAGGPASLTPPQVRAILQQSTFPHDLDPNSN